LLVVSIPVSDQDRAKAFYVGTLGFDLVRDDDSVPGLRWIEVTPKGGGTGADAGDVV
jgi:catechol 2,3-dioxygenase-like lactoylglutathione lyase family enzyme